MTEYYSIVYMHYFFFLPIHHGHLYFFYILPIVNSAEINIECKYVIGLLFSFPLGILQEVQLLDHVDLFLFF